MKLLPIWVATAVLSGAALAGPDARGTDPRIIPVDQAGVRHLVGASRGRVVVLNFWATWCAPCMEEFPDLLRLRRELGGKGVDVFFVSIDDQRDTATSVRAFLRRSGVTFPVYIKSKGDDEGFINSIDPEWSGALPATFIYNPEGKLLQMLVDRQTFDGMLHRVQPLLTQQPH